MNLNKPYFSFIPVTGLGPQLPSEVLLGFQHCREWQGIRFPPISLYNESVFLDKPTSRVQLRLSPSYKPTAHHNNNVIFLSVVLCFT